MIVIYKVGTIKRVKKDDSISPKITAPPKDCHISLERVIGIRPQIVQIEVMNIASSLDLPASIIDSSKGMPLFLLIFILSTKIIAFLTTIPNRASIPIRPGKLNGTLKIAIPIKVPIKAKGIVVIIMKVFLNELNWITIVETIRTIAMIIAKRIEVTDSVFSSFSPP